MNLVNDKGGSQSVLNKHQIQVFQIKSGIQEIKFSFIVFYCKT